MDKYRFHGLGQFESHCGIKRFGNMLLLIELDDNKGTNITNACVLLATELAEKFGIKPEELEIVEFYPRNDLGTRFSKANLEIAEPWLFAERYVRFRCESHSPMTEKEAASLFGRNTYKEITETATATK